MEALAAHSVGVVPILRRVGAEGSRGCGDRRLCGPSPRIVDQRALDANLLASGMCALASMRQIVWRSADAVGSVWRLRCWQDDQSLWCALPCGSLKATSPATTMATNGNNECGCKIRMARELLADHSNDQLHRIHSLCQRAPCAGAWLIRRRWRVWRRVQHSLSREHRAWARANAAQMQLLDFGERNLRIFAHKFPRHTVARSGRAGAKRPKVRS
jgi:hypothetical protein